MIDDINDWDGLDWRFMVWAITGTVVVDDYKELYSEKVGLRTKMSGASGSTALIENENGGCC